MNKKVLKTMIILTIVFLFVVYVAKIFFPEWFVLTITNENIIAFGNYVDTHLWADVLATFVGGYVTYLIYCCACCGKWRLNWKDNLIVLLASILNVLIWYFANTFYLHFSVVVMFALPLIFDAKFKNTVIVYSFHGLAQILSLSIRDIGLMLPSYNYASLLILSIDAYLWLSFFYLLYNIKENKDGR